MPRLGAGWVPAGSQGAGWGRGARVRSARPLCCLSSEHTGSCARTRSNTHTHPLLLTPLQIKKEEDAKKAAEAKTSDSKGDDDDDEYDDGDDDGDKKDKKAPAEKLDGGDDDDDEDEKEEL